MRKIVKSISLILFTMILLNYSIVLANEQAIASNSEEENAFKSNQEKKIEESKTKTNPVIEPGTYEIYIGINDTKVIDIQEASLKNGANAQIYERTNAMNQKFKVVFNEDGTYTFFAMHSNKVLDIRGAGMTNGTNVWQYESNHSNAQKWTLQQAGDGYYYIVSKLNGLYLDIAGGKDLNCQNIQVYEGNGTKAQKFKFSKILNNEGSKTIEEGTYKIYSKVAQDRVLEIPDGNIANGEGFKTGTNRNTANQKFNIAYNKDGTYSITVMHTGKAMDVKGAGVTNMTPVQQYDNNRNRSAKMDH